MLSGMQNTFLKFKLTYIIYGYITSNVVSVLCMIQNMKIWQLFLYWPHVTKNKKYYQILSVCLNLKFYYDI
jgi:hypothetical protein